MSIKELIKNEKDSVRLNVEFFIELRNKIEHRFMPEIDTHIVGECQAFILNFEELLVKEFGTRHSILDSLFIPIQLTSCKKSTPSSQSGNRVLDFINQYRINFASSIYNDDKFSFRLFLLPKIGNYENSSNAAIEFIKVDHNSKDQRDLIDKFVVAIKEKSLPAQDSHKLRPNQVLKLIYQKTGINKNMTWHTNMWKKYNVRNNEDKYDIKYCIYNFAFSTFTYNEEWVNLLINEEIL